MIKIQGAQIYSTQGCMAYQVDYSDGTSVRAIECPGHIIRKEYKAQSGWQQSGKAYKIEHNKHRQGERIKAAAISFCR